MTTRYNIIRRIINRGGEFPLSQKRKFRDMFKLLSDGIETALGMASAPTVQNQLLSGTVTWISGLTFVISDCVFVIDGEVYTAAGSTVTLSDADATNDRIDVFYADSNGTTGVLEGTAAADPAKPVVDTTEQVEISFVLIAALATEPTGVSNTVVYDEDDDWTSAAVGNADAAATADPYAGTKHIQFTNASNNDSYVSLTNSSAVSTGNFDKLTMRIKPTQIGKGRRSGIQLQYYLGNDVVGTGLVRDGTYGLDSGTDAYQLVSIPTSDMPFAQFDAIRILPVSDGMTFALDNIYLQTGANSAGAAYAYTNVSNPWTAAQASPVIQLTDAATIDVDLSKGNVFEVTLGDNRTIDFRNALTGQHFTMIVKQDAIGSRTLTWDSANDWAGGTAPTLSTGANAVDVLTFMIDSSGNIHGTLGIADSQ